MFDGERKKQRMPSLLRDRGLHDEQLMYILRRRAFRAFAELLNTDYSRADIAYRCGFYDQAHFTKVFVTLFGITPGRLRSRMN
jgi:AraC-like DNA-binding protein